MIQKLIQNPKLVFLFDALGALLTTTLIGGLLIRFQPHIGLSTETLYVLASIAAVLSIYSSACCTLVKKNWKPFLRIIIAANFLYCCFTLTLIIQHYQQMTTLGLAYFIGELLVIAGVIGVEVKALKMGVR